MTLKSVRSAGASDLKDQDEWAYCRSEPSRAEMLGPDGLGPTLEQEILAQIQERRSRVQPKVWSPSLGDRILFESMNLEEDQTVLLQPVFAISMMMA